ncbi:MAG: ATP-dependent DNA helicase RecQ [Lewinellaceae bacterium]|nr:ATP-dependent DNA helicase RecQ [Saprospiraceae bacterium]MCB9341693.1 ATP-dependent DNA helicase RecQ [Lewinellaceae bacterium]
MNIREILQTHFGHHDFRDLQEPAIQRLLLGENTLCLMPTGVGKSIIFQVAGIALEKTTLVISPLLALMNQQTMRLANQKLSVLAFNSALGDSQKQSAALKDFFKNQPNPRFLYVSPEKLMSDGFLDFVLRKNRDEIGLVVVDEAHCVSQWGHDFRPAYKFIPQCLDTIFGAEPRPPILCLTATLAPRDLEEVCRDFGIPKQGVLRSEEILRSNIELIIEPVFENHKAKVARLREILEKHWGEKIIVYTHIKRYSYGTRKMAELFATDFSCQPFDADLPEDEKRNTLSAFERGDLKIVFATSAFGMGIDIQDIRVVVHYLMPESIEQYIQETGRAGRDDKPSFAYLLHTPANVKVREDLIRQDFSVEALSELFYGQLFMKNYRQDNPSRYLIYDWSDAKEEEMLPKLFFQMQQFGLATPPVRCFQFVDCFEARVENAVFKQYASLPDIFALDDVARHVGEPLAAVAEKIYEEFYHDRLKLKRQMKNVLFFRLTRIFEANDFELLAAAMNERATVRLNNFRQFCDFIELDAPEREGQLRHFWSST